MTKLTKLIIVCASAAIVVGALVWWLFAKHDDEVHIGKTIHLLKETIVPMRLKVIARSDGSAQVAVKFFDVDGKAVGRCEQQYTGGAITLRLLDVAIGDRHIFFPHEMTQPSKTDTLRLRLQKFYVKDGFPMVYDSQVIAPALKDEIQHLYGHILAGDTARLHKLYGTIRQIDITLSEPMERVNYSLTVKASGEVRF
ncbi:MAG: hypothetical protein II852_13105 [Bacteroidales bacterium]|jgi:hypothetical protein|nr:hypothetical protein [Bacteroidales bacterium]